MRRWNRNAKVKSCSGGCWGRGRRAALAQVLVPFAATLSPVAQRGKVVGTVMSGLLMGILLARTVAGALSSLGDWHTVYWAAAALMLLNTLARAGCQWDPQQGYDDETYQRMYYFNMKTGDSLWHKPDAPYKPYVEDGASTASSGSGRTSSLGE